MINVTWIFLLLSFISIFFILLASFKLFRTKNIPGSKLIFFAVIGSLVIAVLPEPEEFFAVEKDGLIFEIIINIFNSFLFLMGAYGFWCLAKYVGISNANRMS